MKRYPLRFLLGWLTILMLIGWQPRLTGAVHTLTPAITPGSSEGSAWKTIDPPLQLTFIPVTFVPRNTPTRTPTPVNIGNFVWSDRDGDGRQDIGEPGVSGVTVQLWNANKTALIDSAVTNTNGNYTVTAPLPGSYRVRVLLPSGFIAFTGKDQAGDDQTDSDINPAGTDYGFTDIFTLAPNVISTTIYDAGLRSPPTPTRTPTPVNIGNFVWNDRDSDGIQDTGEAGISGVTVQLWNANKTALIDSAITNTNGNYTVTAPLPGSYRVRVLLPASGYTFTARNQGTDDQLDSDINQRGVDAGFTDVFTLAPNVISTTIYDAGLRLPPTPTRTPTPISIGDFVWYDTNGNGIQNTGEPGVPNVTVQLWNGAKTALIASAVTNNSGRYTVIAPVPGSYRIRVLLPSGAEFAPKDQGANDQLDSDINPDGTNFGFTDAFILPSNLISTSLYDAGFIGSVSLATITPTRTATATRTATRTTISQTPTRTATVSRTPTRVATPTRTRTPGGVQTPTRTAVPTTAADGDHRVNIPLIVK